MKPDRLVLRCLLVTSVQRAYVFATHLRGQRTVPDGMGKPQQYSVLDRLNVSGSPECMKLSCKAISPHPATSIIDYDLTSALSRPCVVPQGFPKNRADPAANKPAAPTPRAAPAASRPAARGPAARPPPPPAAGPSARSQPAAGSGVSLSGLHNCCCPVQQVQCCLLGHPIDDRGGSPDGSMRNIGRAFLTAVIADAGSEGRCRTSAGPSCWAWPARRRRRPPGLSSCLGRHR